jgi:hypothetical protein
MRVSRLCRPAGARTPWYARIPTASAVGYDFPSLRDSLNGSTTTNFASVRDSGYYRHAKFFEQGDDVPLPVRWRYKLDRWRSQIAEMFHSEPKALRPRLCPACGTLVGATANKCHQCGANMTFSFAAASRSLGRWMPQTSPVTYVILAICCVMYALSFVITMKFSGGEGAGGGFMNLGGIASQVTYRLGASLPLVYDISQPWRLVTAIFLHGGLMHIGFNMWVLMDIGPRLGAILVLVCCYGRGWIPAQFFSGPLQRRRVGFAAGPHRRAPRGNYGEEEHGRAGSPERADSLAHLYRSPRFHF